MYLLSDRLFFPPVENALEDGLLAIGGDLSAERLKLAYASGIFPWYEGEQILWWSPDPRFVLFPDKIKVSRSMLRVIKSGRFTFSFNQEFEQVIENCQNNLRADGYGTWITDDMKRAYIYLHHQGFAVSAETWFENKLVGGLYGVVTGKVFCGESMFSKMTDASKFCFIQMLAFLQQKDIKLIDCQVYTEHLESLGAEMIPRKDFIKYLNWE